MARAQGALVAVPDQQKVLWHIHKLAKAGKSAWAIAKDIEATA
jgi:hypothetical protein